MFKVEGVDGRQFPISMDRPELWMMDDDSVRLWHIRQVRTRQLSDCQSGRFCPDLPDRLPDLDGDPS